MSGESSMVPTAGIAAESGNIIEASVDIPEPIAALAKGIDNPILSVLKVVRKRFKMRYITKDNGKNLAGCWLTWSFDAFNLKARCLNRGGPRVG